MVPPSLSFFEEDNQGTFQPHDDTLVLIIRIGGYNVRRVSLWNIINQCILRRWIAKNEVSVQEILHSFKRRKLKVGMLAIFS